MWCAYPPGKSRLPAPVSKAPADNAVAPARHGAVRHFLWRLIAIVVLVDLFVAGIAALFLEQSRQRERQQAEAATASLAKVLEENLQGMIGRIDLTLLMLRDQIARQETHGGIDGAAIDALLTQTASRLPEALGLRVVDAEGTIRHAANGVAVSGASIADRPQFIQMREHADAGLVISSPLFGRTGQDWIITLSRRLDHPDGSFAGDVHASVTLAQLTRIFSAPEVGPRGSVSLWNDDPTMIARYSAQAGFTSRVGGVVPSAELAQTIAAKVDATVYHAPSGADGVTRTFSVRRIGALPLWLTVGVADDDYLEEWRRTARLMSGLVLLFVATTAVLALVIHRSWRRGQDHTAAIERARARSESILSSAGEGICGVDAEGRVIFINAAARRMLGWAADQGLGLDLHQQSHHHHADGSDYPRTDCPTCRTLADGRDRHVDEDVFWRRDGSSFPVEFTVGPILVEGAVHGAVTVFRDITERRRIEESLRQSESLARTLMNASADAAFLMDRDGILLTVNEALAARFGIPAEDLPGRSLFDLIPPALAEKRRAECQSVFDSGLPFHGQDERDGMALDNRIHPLRAEGGAVTRVAVFSRDITASQRAEREIRDLLSYQRAILGNSPIGIAIFDQERRLTAANEALTRLFGREGENLLGRSARLFYASDAVYQDIGARAYPVVRDGGTFSDDVPMVRRDGSEVWVHLIAHQVDPANPALGVIWTAEDITSRKQMEFDLKRSNQELERFAYVASHDLRQPLRMISSYLTLIERRMKDRIEADEREFFAFAVDGAKRMDAMIVDLLDYSRIGRSGIGPEMVALDQVLGNVQANLEEAIADAGATVSVQPGLPSLPGIESELERLFQNLIANALKFRRPDQAPVVEVEWRDAGREWIVSVSDNGIGIAVEDRPRLFMVFQRLVSREQYEGTGIGLASCRKIAEHHGGRIWIESAASGGSTFLVALPKPAGGG